MPQFSGESAIQTAGTGAAIGSFAGPIGTGIGAAAGFVIGGIAGGLKKQRAARKAENERKKLRRLQRRFEYLSSPEYLNEVATQLRPKIREQIAGTFEPQIKSAIATNIGRRGLTGTGIGTSMQTAGALAGDTAAGAQSLDLAKQAVNNQLQAEQFSAHYLTPQTGYDFSPLLSDQQAKTIADTAALFGALKTPKQQAPQLFPNLAGTLQ